MTAPGRPEFASEVGSRAKLFRSFLGFLCSAHLLPALRRFGHEMYCLPVVSLESAKKLQIFGF